MTDQPASSPRTALPMNASRWKQGLTLPDFVAQMSVDQDIMMRRLETVQLRRPRFSAPSAFW